MPLPSLLGHGIDGGAELPVSPWMFGYLAGAVVLVTSAALGADWPTARLDAAERPAGGRDDVVRAEEEEGPARRLLRAAGVLALLVVVGSAAFGDEIVTQNLAPVAVYVLFWAGLTVVGSLVADVWNAGLDPFSTLGRLVAPPTERRYRWEAWPAATGLLAFLWLMLVHPDRARPRTLAVLLVVHLALVLAGAVAWGRPFLRRGEPFAAWFGLLGALAPVRRDRATGRLRAGPPVVGLAGIDATSGLVALVLVVLGATAFDGLRETSFWSGVVGARSTAEAVPLATVGLLGSIAVVALVYLGAVRLVADVTGRAPAVLARMFAHALVPIAAAFVIAHAVPLLVVEGQAAVALVSDPFGVGWNLFGTADRSVDYTAVSGEVVALVQVVTIAAGLIAAVVLVHDRVLARLPKEVATRAKYPLLVALGAFGVSGLGLLLGA